MNQNKMYQIHTAILDDDDNENVKLINELMNADDKPRGIEGFIGYNLPPGVNSKPTYYEKQSIDTLNNSSLSPQQIKDLNDMKSQYNYLIDQYNETYGKMKNEIKNFIDRTDPANPFLNSNILLDGRYGNVTNLGNVEWYDNKADFDATAGKNGCPVSNKIKNVTGVKWSTYISQAGNDLPTKPPLRVSNVKATKGQSCGNEGVNVYVSSISNSKNPPKYEGCYGDKENSRAMTLLNKTPVSFSECEDLSQRASYNFFSLQGLDNGKAMCYGSNSLDESKKYGDVSKLYEDKVIWSVGDGKAKSVRLTTDGKMKVFDNAGNVLFSNPDIQYVKFYHGSGYTGKETSVSVGSYSSMGKAGLTPNSISSLKIPKGLSIILYIKPNFKTDANNLSITLGPGNYPNLSTLKGTTGNFDNAVSSMKIFATDGYFLNLGKDGNLCIFAGNPSNKTTWTGVWCNNTVGKIVGTGNPEKDVSKGKYGRNYLKQTETLNLGEWIGCGGGLCYLMLTKDGYLNLVVPGNIYSKCNKGTDSKLYGKKDEANALYSSQNLGDPSLIGKIGYIDQDSKLSEYPSTMVSKLGSSYTIFPNSTSLYNGLRTLPNSNISQCKSECDARNNCGGFVFDNANSICNLKSNKTYPKASRIFESGTDLYVRTPTVENNSTCRKEIVNIDSNQWKNYIKSGSLMTPSTQCNLMNSTLLQQKLLDSLSKQIDVLANKIQIKNSDFKTKQKNSISQINKNNNVIKNSTNDYKEIVKYNEEQQSYLDGMLDDSRLVMLQQNQKYIMWSVLTLGSIILAVNLSR